MQITKPRFDVLLRLACGALLAVVAMQPDVLRHSAEAPVALAIQDATPRAGDLVLARKSVTEARVVELVRVTPELGAAYDHTTAPAAVIAGATDLREVAREAAVAAGINPDIFIRQIQVESGFDPAARSSAGAIGIAQIMPQYHPDVDPTNPVASLRYAATLMAGHLASYGDDYAKALAAYNAGPGAVAQHGGVPPFAETQNYVSKILGSGEGGGGGMNFEFPKPVRSPISIVVRGSNRSVDLHGDQFLRATLGLPSTLVRTTPF